MKKLHFSDLFDLLLAVIVTQCVSMHQGNLVALHCKVRSLQRMPQSKSMLTHTYTHTPGVLWLSSLCNSKHTESGDLTYSHVIVKTFSNRHQNCDIIQLHMVKKTEEAENTNVFT